MNVLRSHTHYRHYSSRFVVRCSAVVLLGLTLSACSTIGSLLPFGSSSNSESYTSISRSLLGAVTQYPEFDPSVTTLQVARPSSKFERSVHNELTSRGYKLERNPSAVDATVVNASVDEIDESVGRAYPLYVVTMGDITVERQFKQINSVPTPASELVVRGAALRPIALGDDKLFGLSKDAAVSTVAFKSSKPVELAQLLDPEPPSLQSGLWNRPRQTIIKSNMYDTMESNYSAIFTDYEEVESDILVFPNDSLRLGEVNKQIIERFVEQMNDETDVLSVIGCSHGHSNISNGNSVLAIGRANRIKEALMFSGVSHEKVLEEGCWAPVVFDAMPNRGVVLTLKRKKNS